MTICTVCESIIRFTNRGLHYGAEYYHALRPFEYHSTMEQLILAARTGCQICDVVLRDLREKFSQQLSGELGVRIQRALCPRPGSNNKPCLYLSLHISEASGLSCSMELNFYLYRQADIQHLVNLDSMRVNAVSNENWEQIERWILECDEQHSGCTGIHNRTNIPTRLLDLNAPCAPDIRLVSTKSQFLDENCSERTTWVERYVTLSHRWNKYNVVQLATSNIDSFHTSIPLDRLPKTFVDAIYITRRLGIRYLWIDSLCILQDCLDDWRLEANTMADVYAGAYFNIAATGAIEGLEGCFQRNGRLMKPVAVRAFWHWHEEECILVESPQDVWARFGSSPLLHRGWVVQERFLARRVLYFGCEQLFWECRSLIACEAYPTGPIDISINSLQDVVRLKYADINDPDRESSDYLDNRYLRWFSIVSSYSRTSLTFDSDKLIALSGIAAEYQRRVLDGGDEYLAGLWRNSLPFSLLWTSLGRPSRRYDSYVAPTWSWVSVSGSVDPATESLTWLSRKLARVDHAEMAYINNNLFGDISGGRLTISGPTMLCKISEDKGKFRLKLYFEGLGRTNLIGWIGSSKWWDLDRFTVLTVYDDDRFFHGKGAAGFENLNLIVMFIADIRKTLESLILQQSPDSPDTFQRIGRCSITENGRIAPWNHQLSEFFQERSIYIV